MFRFLFALQIDVSECVYVVLGMIVIDSNGNVAGGTTTNGMNHKIPG